MNTGPERQMMPQVSTQDSELIERICQRDQRALAALYDQMADRVYSLAFYILRNPDNAEEVTQDIFMKIWDRADQWDERKAKLSTWILAMTRNAAIDRLRKEKRRPAVIDSPFDKILQMEAVESDGHQLRTLLHHLPKEQQQAIYLNFFGGMSHTDIAEATGIPLGTIKTRLRLGLKKLRSMWMERS
jgi:RNA polymerase sigma-70 factor (ECF subfamily)